MVVLLAYRHRCFINASCYLIVVYIYPVIARGAAL